MRKFRFLTFVVLSLSALPLILLASTALDYFAAKSNGDQVSIEWKTDIETNVTKFDVERAPAGSQQFTYLGTVQSKGSYSDYTYTDESVLQKPTNTQSVYQYRIKIYSSDGSFAYSQTTTVEFSASSVKRTWGQIKEMFR